MTTKKYFTNSYYSIVAPCSKDIKITGPTTVYAGDEVTLTCQAGPSYPGQFFFLEVLTFIMIVLEMILTWEPENIGWNKTNKNENYIPNSNDPRIVTSSNINVKVTDKISYSK